MGFTYEMITVLQNQESPTLSLLEEWERQLGELPYTEVGRGGGGDIGAANRT